MCNRKKDDDNRDEDQGRKFILEFLHESILLTLVFIVIVFLMWLIKLAVALTDNDKWLVAVEFFYHVVKDAGFILLLMERFLTLTARTTKISIVPNVITIIKVFKKLFKEIRKLSSKNRKENKKKPKRKKNGKL